MKKKDKTGKKELSDFLRYRNGEMTDLEKNAFERELQKDPFAEEAAEGLAELTGNEAEKDLIKLNRKLESRITSRNRFLYYRIAASVAVLMIITSVYFIVHRQGINKEPGEVSTYQEPLGINAPEAIISQETEKKAAQKSEEGGKKVATAETRDQNKKSTAKPEKQLITDEEVMVPVRTEDLKVAESMEALELQAAPAAPAGEVRKISMETSLVRGRIVSSDDNMPIPGASITVKGTNQGVLSDTGGRFEIALPGEADKTLVASFIGMKSKEFQAKEAQEMEIDMEPDEVSLSEVVVVGYGARSDTKSVKADNEYSPPQPQDGRSLYNRYIEENIRIPETLPEGKREVVIISFRVTASGKIDDLKILKSAGTEYSEEARRLILNGPSWKPATSGGVPVEDSLRLRVIFKK
jgi:hypothetical protein